MGFRALAYVEQGRCTLVSRRRHVYKQFSALQMDISQAVRTRSCILDGEIVCLAPDGRSQFYELMFRRAVPCFIAFDVLAVDVRDLRAKPLVERKRRLRAILRESAPRVLFHDHIDGRGVALFDAVRGRDLEGIVAKW